MNQRLNQYFYPTESEFIHSTVSSDSFDLIRFESFKFQKSPYLEYFRNIFPNSCSKKDWKQIIIIVISIKTGS